MLKPLFAETCRSCANFISTVDMLRSGEVSLHGRAGQVVGAESPGGPGPTTVIARLRFGGATFTNRAGQVVASEPSGELQDQMTLQRVGDTWRVLKITRLKP